MSEFAPKVVIFCCNWCFCTGTEPAEVLNIKPNSNIRVVKTMCSGRIEPFFIVQAFANGADGVMVAGCHPGDCHYNSGNYKTLRRLMLLKTTLAQLGIEPERLKLEWIATEEADKFRQSVAEFIKDVSTLGQLNYDKEVAKVAAAV